MLHIADKNKTNVNDFMNIESQENTANFSVIIMVISTPFSVKINNDYEELKL